MRSCASVSALCNPAGGELDSLDFLDTEAFTPLYCTLLGNLFLGRECLPSSGDKRSLSATTSSVSDNFLTPETCRILQHCIHFSATDSFKLSYSLYKAHECKITNNFFVQNWKHE